MFFNISLYNHSPWSQQTLLDMALPIRDTLIDLGHNATISVSLMGAPAINLVFEAFEQPLVDQLKGYVYGVICTEVLDEAGGLNHRGDPHMENRTYWLRQALLGAKFAWLVANDTVPIWSGLPERVGMLRPMGYVPTLVQPLRGRDYQFDVAFFGSRSPERDRLMRELMGAGLKTAYIVGADKRTRDEAIRASKWVLGLRPASAIKLHSTTRITSSIYARCPILLETVDFPLDAVASAATYGFPMTPMRTGSLREIVLGRGPETVAQLQLRQLVRVPFRPQLEAALDRSLSAVSEVA